MHFWSVLCHKSLRHDASHRRFLCQKNPVLLSRSSSRIPLLLELGHDVIDRILTGFGGPVLGSLSASHRRGAKAQESEAAFALHSALCGLMHLHALGSWALNDAKRWLLVL